MGKKYVIAQKAGRNYRIYIDDIKRIYHKPTKKSPPLPSFEKSETKVTVTETLQSL